MFIAININGERIHIKNASEVDQYFCSTCGEKLILRKGDIRTHHFAHSSKNMCKDTWHYDMSYWHLNWQSKFPIDCQEVVKEFNGEKHRADVLIEETKTVIEFQHSSLSFDEFNKRNEFYNKLGYKVIWIFDVVDEFDNCELISDEKREESYKWKKPKWKFNKIDLKNNVEVYFQLDNHFRDDEKINIYKNNWDISINNSQISNYFARHQFDEGSLLKVDSVCDEGFKTFISNSEQSVTSFLNAFSEYVDINFPSKIAELNDSLTFIGKIKKVGYFYGCPLSLNHICIDSRLYSNVVNIPCCEECEFGNIFGEIGKCSKAIRDLNIEENSKLKGFTIDSNGIITKIKYEINSNIFVKEKESYCFENIYDSIPNIWNKYNLKIATFKNVNNGEYVRITSNPLIQLSKYKNIYGRKSNHKMKFIGDSVKITEASNKCWILVWSKE